MKLTVSYNDTYAVTDKEGNVSLKAPIENDVSKRQVVKELTENAIDANAGSVTIEIKEGGISYIRITDNGTGIPKEQVKDVYKRQPYGSRYGAWRVRLLWYILNYRPPPCQILRRGQAGR